MYNYNVWIFGLVSRYEVHVLKDDKDLRAKRKSIKSAQY
jgi:hypothetical protein